MQGTHDFIAPEQQYDAVGGNVNTENSQFGIMAQSPLSLDYQDNMVSPQLPRQQKAENEEGLVYSVNSGYKDGDLQVLRSLYAQQQKEEAIDIEDRIIDQVV